MLTKQLPEPLRRYVATRSVHPALCHSFLDVAGGKPFASFAPKPVSISADTRRHDKEDDLRQLILRMSLTFDGVSPGKKGGMDMVDFSDEESWTDIFATLQRVDAMLIGGKSQEEYLGHWQKALEDPKASPSERRYAEVAMRTPHFVVSRTLRKALTPNATILSSGVDGIADLKKQPGRDLLMWGGATVAAATIDAGLVDEYHFEIHPAIAATGQKLFDNVVKARHLRHLDTKTFRSGVFVIKYAKVDA